MPPAAADDGASMPEPLTVTAATMPEAAAVNTASTPKAAGAQNLTPLPSSKVSASEREPLEDGHPTPVATGRGPHRSRSPTSPDVGGGGGSGRSSGTGYNQPGSSAFASGRQRTPEHTPPQPPASNGNQCSLGDASPQPSTAEPRDAVAAPCLQLPALAVTPLREACVDTAPTLCSPAAGSLCQGPAVVQPSPGRDCVSPAGSSPQSAQTQHPAAVHRRPATPPLAAWLAGSPSPGSDYGSPAATLATASVGPDAAAPASPQRGSGSAASQEDAFWSPRSDLTDELAPTMASPFATGPSPAAIEAADPSSCSPSLRRRPASPVLLPTATNLSAAFEEQAQRDVVAAPVADSPGAAAAAAAATPTTTSDPAASPSPQQRQQQPSCADGCAAEADPDRCYSPGSPQVTAGLLSPQPSAPGAASPLGLAAAPDGNAAAAPPLPLPQQATPPAQPPAPSPLQPSEDTITATPPRPPLAADDAAPAASSLEVSSEAAGAAIARRFMSRRLAQSCPNPKARYKRVLLARHPPPRSPGRAARSLAFTRPSPPLGPRRPHHPITMPQAAASAQAAAQRQPGTKQQGLIADAAAVGVTDLPPLSSPPAAAAAATTAAPPGADSPPGACTRPEDHTPPGPAASPAARVATPPSTGGSGGGGSAKRVTFRQSLVEGPSSGDGGPCRPPTPPGRPCGSPCRLAFRAPPAPRARSGSFAAWTLRKVPAGSPPLAGDCGQVPEIPRSLKYERKKQLSFAAARVAVEVSKISGRAAAEQEFREAYLNSKLARQWAGGAAWAAMDFVGVPLTHAAAAAHHATYQQAAGRVVAAVGQEAAQALQAQVEGEWRALKSFRRRVSAPKASPAGAAAGADAAAPQPVPRSILKRGPAPASATAAAASPGTSSLGGGAAAAAAAETLSTPLPAVPSQPGEHVPAPTGCTLQPAVAGGSRGCKRGSPGEGLENRVLSEASPSKRARNNEAVAQSLSALSNGREPAGMPAGPT